MKLKDILEALNGIDPETEVIVTPCYDNGGAYEIVGIYDIDGKVELEVAETDNLTEVSESLNGETK